MAEHREDAQRLQALLQQLPSSQREVIRQRIYEGKRFREIAEALGCPLNTALARMHEGLKRLRLLWEQDHA
jgi:RNA polymerase sigma-70 factor (ECF subfamily)